MVWISSTISPTCCAEVVSAPMVLSALRAESVASRASSAEDAACRLISPIDMANSSLAEAAAVAPRLASSIAPATSPARRLVSSAVAAISLAVPCNWLEAATTPVTTSPTVRSNWSATSRSIRSRSSRASSCWICSRVCSSSSALARSARSRLRRSRRRPARWNTCSARAISPISS